MHSPAGGAGAAKCGQQPVLQTRAFQDIIGRRLTDIVRTLPQAAQALQNVDNSLELACQWLLATAAREDGDDAEPSGAQVRLPDISH